MGTRKAAHEAPLSPQANPPCVSKAWQKKQQKMVEAIADHALEGGRDIAGQNANMEDAIDAYLTNLRADLLRLAQG